MEEFKK